MAAGVHNITLEQGALFEMIVRVMDNQPTPQPIDLTGYSFEGQIRPSHNAKTATASFQFTILDQGDSQTIGKVRVYIPAAQTALIPVSGAEVGERVTALFLYDISYGPTGGEKYRLLQGTASVVGEVTK